MNTPSSAERWALPLLALLACLAFGGTLGFGFVWDDHEQIVDNEALRSWSSAGTFWTTDVLGTTRDSGERSTYYRPLFFTQYLLLYQAFGLDARAWHAGALLLHLLATIAAWRLLRSLRVEPWTALLAASLFLVHPVHTESVSWLAAAYNDPPTAGLLLLALAAHVRWLRQRQRLALAGACLAFAAALCIKESALSFLLLVPVVEGAVRRDDAWTRILRPPAVLLATLAAVLVAEVAGWPPAGGSSWLTLVLQALVCGAVLAWVGRAASPAWRSSWAAYLALTLAYFQVRRLAIGTTLGALAADLDWRSVAATQPILLGWYARFVVWPWDLSPSYPLRYVDPRQLTPILLASTALLAGAFVAWRAARRHRATALGFLWLPACLLPALNTQAFREAYLVHHRYLYLAILGPSLLVAWGLDRLPASRRVRVFLATSIVALLALGSMVQNRHWRSDHELWLRVAEIDPANAAASDWLGVQALEAGRIEEAESWFRISATLDPPSGRGAYNLGLLLQRERGDPRAALPWYEVALSALRRDRPEENELYVRCAGNYGLALAQLGDVDRALLILEELAGPPHFEPGAARNAAVLLVGRGDTGRAVEILERALRAHPGEPVLSAMRRDLQAEGEASPR